MSESGYHYQVFGRRLHSDIPLADLAVTPSARPHWTLRRSASSPRGEVLEEVGRHMVERWEYRLFRTEWGLRLRFAEQYLFEISVDGSEIVWLPREGALEENVRALVLGPVLALAQSLQGGFCLHGSAVATPEGGIAFLGSKFQGKSTLSLALSRAGARLLSDDCVAIDMDEGLAVSPGVHSVRLWNDSAETLRAAEIGGQLLKGMKNTLAALPREMLQHSAVPLRALYLLESVPQAGALPPARRTAVAPSLALVSIACHTKIPQSLLGRKGSAAQFQKAAELVRSVPVFRLQVVRDFEQLEDVTSTILGWHARNPAASGAFGER